MTNFTLFDLSFANCVLQSHRDRVEVWSKDDHNPELRNACQMLIQAGKQAQEAEKP